MYICMHIFIYCIDIIRYTILCKIYYGTIRSLYQLHAHRVIVDVLMPWSPFFILIHQRASCQEFALCILLITWSSFDLTQVWQGQNSIWRHGTNIQDVSWEFQFKCYCTSGVRLINWYHSNSNLLESTSASNLHGQEFDYLEYFAGAGEITKHMLASKYRAVRLDLLDFTPESPNTSNYMDLNQSAGYAFLWMKRIPLVFCCDTLISKNMAHRICKTNPQFQK
jgi:hypothetical protein